MTGGKRILTTTTAALSGFAIILVASTSAALQTRESPSDLQQFTSGAHILGFDSRGYYVSNGSYALRVIFDHSTATQPSSGHQRERSRKRIVPLDQISYSE